MPKYYDLYVNNQWKGQYHNKKDAISDAKNHFTEDEDVFSVKVILCEDYDPRAGGTTIYLKEREVK